MARTRELKVKITGDERDLARAFGRSDSAASKWGRALSTFGKAAAFGLAGAGIAAVKFGLDFVEAAEESVKIGKQTQAVIKSTGGAANITAGQVGKLAEQLSLKAGIDDELIQSGENVLLTFTNIRNEIGKGNDIFNQATALALDMSVALGTDLQSANIQLGKALNDPIKGITALTRVGVSFTDQQKDQIKALVESGDVLGAQKVILQELTKEFGGSAEAQATATDKLKVAFDNIGETIGMVLLPYVNQFSDWLVKEGIPLIRDEFIPWLRDELIPALQDFAAWIRDEILPNLEKVGPVIRDDILPALQELTEAITALPGAVQVALASLGLLAKFGGFGVLAGAATIMGKVIATVFGFIGFAATMAFNLILKIAPFSHLATLAFIFRDQVTAAFRFIADIAVRAFTFLRDRAAANIQGIASKIAALPGQVAGALGRLANLFGSAMSSAWRQVTSWVSSIVSAILSIPRRIAGVGGRIKDAILGGLSGIAGDIIDMLPSPGGGVPFIPGIAKGGIITSSGVEYLQRGGWARGTDTVPAMLTPGEMVLTRADQRHLLGMIRGGGGGGGGTVIVNVAGSVVVERDLISAINRGIEKGYRLGGHGRRTP